MREIRLVNAITGLRSNPSKRKGLSPLHLLKGDLIFARK